MTHFKATKNLHLSNITKNINLKGIILKIVEQNKNLEKLLTAKKQSIKKQSNKSININQYTYYPSQKIKGRMPGMQNNKKRSLDKKDKDKNIFDYKTEKNKINKFINKDNSIYKNVKTLNKNITDINDDNKWQRLKTEVNKNKNINFLEKRKKNIFIDYTLDAKNNIGFISDNKRIALNNKNNKKTKYEINSYINERRDKRNKRIESDTFSDNNTNSIYNRSINKANIIQNKNNSKKLFRKLKILTGKGKNEQIYASNNIYNYSNRKSTYDSEISDNNNIKTEPSEYINFKNRDNRYNNFKSNTNTIEAQKINRVLRPKKLNINFPATYFHYLNSIKKSNNSIPKNNKNTIKKAHNNDILKTNQDNKNIISKTNKTAISSKKNSFITIRSTVINFNMINSGSVLPPFSKKNQDKKKHNLTTQYNNNNQNNTKKTINESSGTLCPQKTLNNNNISLNKKLFLNQYCFKPLYKTKTLTKNHVKNKNSFNNSLNPKNLLYSLNQKLKEQTLTNKSNNKDNYITSFKKLLNKNKKKKLLYSKKHSNSTERSDIIFKSIKLNEFYLKILKQKKDRKYKIKLGINNIITKENKTLDVNKNIRRNSFQNKTKPNIINLIKK
jgi:hypothetical protein